MMPAIGLLLLTLAASPEPAPAAPPPSPAPPVPAAQAQAKAQAKAPAPKGVRIPARSSLPTVEGEVSAIDHRTHRLTLQAAAGQVVLAFDRDTLVLGPAGAETPLQITPGLKVKVGRDGEARAAWVELPPAPSTRRPSP